VEKAQQDKRSIIIRAEGDAESARMISEAIQSNPYYLELKTIEAARDIAQSLANSQNKVYLSSDMLMFNLLGSLGGYVSRYSSSKELQLAKSSDAQPHFFPALRLPQTEQQRFQPRRRGPGN
jgi:hypothetical protein